MQLGQYIMFDEPLTTEEIAAIKKINDLFPRSPGKPNFRLIYKEFNNEWTDPNTGKVYPPNPDLPDYKYSLGWKVTTPSVEEAIKPGMPTGMKRILKRLLP